MTVPTTLVIDATQQTLEVTTSRDAISLRGRDIETGTPTNGEVLTYSTSASEWIYQSVDENVDDRVAALIQDSAGGGLTWTYNDSAGTLTPAYVGDSTLVTSGALNSGSITSGFTSIDVGAGAITTTGTVTGGVLAGTLSTAAQSNVTSLGTLTGLTVGSLTSGRVVLAGTSGVLQDDAGFVFNTSTNTLTTDNFAGDFSVTNTTADASYYLTFVSASATGSRTLRADAGVYYNPSSNTLTSDNLGGTLTTAAQTAITSVGALGAGSISSGFGTVNIGSSALTAGAASFTTISGSTSLALASGATVTGIDNGSLGTSATLLATQGAIKTYVDAQVTAQDLDIITSSGNIDIDLDSESLTLTGGTGLASSATGTTVTFAIDSTVATLSGSQTLTNKTIAGGSNTLSAIANGSLTNSTVAYGGVTLALGASDSTPAFNLSDGTAYPGDSSLVTCGTISSGTWNGSVITGGYIDATSSPLANTKIWIGSASNAAAEFALSGNATMTAGGVVTVSTAAACTGNAATATLASTVVVVDSTDATSNIAMFDSATGSLAVKTDAGITYNSSTAALSATTFVGALTGSASGSSGSCTGNAATATALATARTIGGTSFDGTANIAVALSATTTALASARTIGGTSFDGTANIAVALSATATALATARAINGTDFDGTAAITVTAAAGTLTGATLNSGVTASSLTSVGTIGTGTWSATKVASAYLDDDTAHLSGTQTFSGAKTFSSTLAVSGSSGAGVGTIRLIANVLKMQAGTGGFTVANSGNSGDLITISDAGAVAAGGTLAVTGNVGMGTGAGVGHALEVVEDAADTNMARFKYTATAAPSASNGLNLWNTATGSTTDGGLVFSMSDNGGIERYAGSITVDKVGTWTSTPSSRDGQMRFNTAVDGVIAERFRIKQTGVVNFTSDVEMAGDLAVTGAVSKGSGSFKIAHPLPAKADTHHLVHSFIEGPQADLIYRGVAALSGGSATVDLDEAAGMSAGTWELLCRDPQVWIQNDSGWGAVRGSVEGNTLTIECESSSDTVSWMVVAERCDPHMMETGWTDDGGRVIVEPEREEALAVS